MSEASMSVQIRRRRAARNLVATAVLAGAPMLSSAATNVVWTGASSGSFDNGANYVGGVAPVNDLATSIATFSGDVTTIPNQPGLSSTRNVGGLLFSTATGGWTLSPSGTRVLSVGGSGISTAGQTSGVDIISAYIGIGSTQIWQAGTGGTLDITGVISGGTNSTISYGSTTNTGLIILGSANTYTIGGGNNFAGGTVQLAAGATLGAGVLPMTGAAGALLDLGGNSTAASTFNGAETILNNGTGTSTLTIGNVSSGGTWNGLIADNNNAGGGIVSLVKMGTGQELFNTANTYSGGTTISGGDFRFTNASAFGSGAITLTGGNLHGLTTANMTVANAIVAGSGTGLISFDTTGDVLSGAFTGTGTLSIQGNQLPTITGSLGNFQGTLDLENSKIKTLSLSNPAGAANAAFVIATADTAVTTLAYSGAIASSPGTYAIGSLTGGSTARLQNSTVGTEIFQVGNTGGSTTYAGIIQNGGGTAITGLSKVGSGTLTLSAPNTYTGSTTVTAGTLALSGAGTTGTGAVTIASGATLDASATTAGGITLGTNQSLGGTGTFVGNLNVGAGRLAIGSSIGTFTDTGSATFGSTSTFAETLDSTAGTADTLAANGNLTLGGALTITDLGAGSYTGSYTLATYTGTLAGTFATTTGLPPGYQVDYSQPNVVLLDNTAPVPEPTSIVLISLVAMPLLGRRRRGA